MINTTHMCLHHSYEWFNSILVVNEILICVTQTCNALMLQQL